MSTAMLFPGLAPSNFTAVGSYMTTDPLVRARLAEADEVLGYSLLDRFRDAGRGHSEYAQLAFVVNCLALADRVVQRPDICIAPSFGQLATACYVGALSFADTLRLTVATARLEAQCVGVVTQFFGQVTDDALPAVLDGLDAEVSCVLGSGFGAVSLPAGDVAELGRRIRAIGGIPLYVMRPPVHASALSAVRQRLEASVYGTLTFADPALPVISDQDGAILRRAGDIRTLLLNGLTRPVVWPAAVATLRRIGVTTVCIPGPSNIFNRVMPSDVHVVTVTPSTQWGAQ